MSRARVLVPLGLLLLAVLWSWPAAGSAGPPGRWPDVLGTLWFLDTAPRWLPTLHDPMTGWPVGATYGRPDSFVLGAVAGALGFLPPRVVLGLVTVLGLTASGWAAERLAADLGARPPWSILAGAGFAFSGLASTALIEGYPYHVVDPWLPLMVRSGLRALGPEGRVRDGVFAGVFFQLALWSTAWLGLSAALLLVGVAAAVPLARWRRGPALAAALTVALPALVYVAVFVAGGEGARETVAASSAGLTRQLPQAFVQISGAGLGIDTRGHSQTHAIAPTVLALALATPLWARNDRVLVALLGAGTASLLLSLAPHMSPEEVGAVLGTPGELLAKVLLRFPARLGWAWALVASVAAARSADHLARRAPRATALLFATLLVDAFVVMRLPLRQGEQVAGAPSAYGAHAGPVLDVFAAAPGGDPAWTLYTTNLACHHQVFHQRPIAEHCLFVAGGVAPRLRLQDHLLDAAMNDEAEPAMRLLGELGFGSVVVHLDQLRPVDATRLLTALEAVVGPPVRSTDGGEAVAAFPVPTAVTDPLPRWQAWTDEAAVRR